MADYRSARSTHILESHLAAGADHGTRLLTSADGDSLATNVPLIYDADGNVVSTATRTGDTTDFLTANAGDSMAQNVPLLYDADGNVISTATRTGNTTNYATATAGSKTNGNYPKWDADGNLTDGDTGSGGGGGHDEAGIYLATAPPTTGWSWVNQGSSTVAQNAFGSIVMVPATQSGFQARMYVRAVPGGDTWKVRMLIAVYPTNASVSFAGWGLRDSGGGEIVSYVLADNGQIVGTAWNSPTSFNANYFTTSNGVVNNCVVNPLWWELDWQATNRVIRISNAGFQDANDGFTMHTVARNDFATFDEIGLFAVGNYAHANPPVVTLLSYEEL